MNKLGRNDLCHCNSGKKYKQCCLERDREIERGERPAFTIDGSKSPTVEDGHIVPRMYQKAWETDGRKVSVHTESNAPCRKRSTKSVATRGPYYRRTRPEGEQLDDTEKSLSVIEDKAAGSLRRLIEGGQIDAETKGIVAQFFAVQIFRGPAFFEQREEILWPSLEALEADHFKPQALAELKGNVTTAREKAIDDYLDPTQRFMTMLRYAVKVASILGLMRWQILHFAGPELAYSDHPVVLWPLDLPSSAPFQRQGLGPIETLEIRVPISPSTAILMNWIDLDDVVGVQMPSTAAAEVNAFTVAQAEKEWAHQIGSEPEVAQGTFKPLSRLIDLSYSKRTVTTSLRHALARKFFKEIRGRKFANEVEVLVDIESALGRSPPRPTSRES